MISYADNHSGDCYTKEGPNYKKYIVAEKSISVSSKPYFEQIGNKWEERGRRKRPGTQSQPKSSL